MATKRTTRAKRQKVSEMKDAMEVEETAAPVPHHLSHMLTPLSSEKEQSTLRVSTHLAMLSQLMMDNSFYLAITFLSSHHKHLLLITSVSSTNCPSSLAVIMDADTAIQDMNPTTLLGWVQGRLRVPLSENNAQKFLSAEIDGEAFLRHTGEREFFQGAGIAYAPSDNLASLAKAENPTMQIYQFFTKLWEFVNMHMSTTKPEYMPHDAMDMVPR
ncbi:hypothetical protein V8E54_006106 [Elaphomyces granulatus]